MAGNVWEWTQDMWQKNPVFLILCLFFLYKIKQQYILFFILRMKELKREDRIYATRAIVGDIDARLVHKIPKTVRREI